MLELWCLERVSDRGVNHDLKYGISLSARQSTEPSAAMSSDAAMAATLEFARLNFFSPELLRLIASIATSEIISKLQSFFYSVYTMLCSSRQGKKKTL